MSNWIPLFFLPNVHAKVPFESEYLAIVSPEDARCVAVGDANPTFIPFLRSFTDAFRRRVVPSVLLMREGAPEWVKSWEAIGGFRDVLSISAVVYNRSLVLNYGHARNYQYSTSFDFYPYMLSTDYQRLVSSNPALNSFDLVEEFHGQATPGLPVSHFDSLDYDEILARALLAEWERRFARPNPPWRNLALFRSLNMAHAAAQIPGVIGVTDSFIGRNISLWVSACEILVHPETNDSGVKQVYALLEQVDWRGDACKSLTYFCYETRRKKQGPLRNLACWIYGEINHARNDYLHGNPLPPGRLLAGPHKKHLFNYPPPLYRLLLTAFLGLNYYGPFKPREPDASPYDVVGILDFRFNSKQRDYEAALAHILKPKDRGDT